MSVSETKKWKDASFEPRCLIWLHISSPPLRDLFPSSFLSKFRIKSTFSVSLLRSLSCSVALPSSHNRGLIENSHGCLATSFVESDKFIYDACIYMRAHSSLPWLPWSDLSISCLNLESSVCNFVPNGITIPSGGSFYYFTARDGFNYIKRFQSIKH